MTLRCAVLVSGRGGNLRALAEAIEAGDCDAEITAVLSDRKRCPALDYAAARGVRIESVRPRAFEGRAGLAKYGTPVKIVTTCGSSRP